MWGTTTTSLSTVLYRLVPDKVDQVRVQSRRLANVIGEIRRATILIEMRRRPGLSGAKSDLPHDESPAKRISALGHSRTGQLPKGHGR